MLAKLRRRGEPVSVSELARSALAAEGLPSEQMARKVVGALLDWEPHEIPDPVHPNLLRSRADRSVADLPIEEATFCVVDLETTGLSPDRCEIIEVGAVRVSRLELCDEYESFIQPREIVPDGITRLTGIDDTMVRDARPAAEVMSEFRGWLAEKPRAPFVAHNASFDSRFVSAALAELALPPLDTPVLCTRRLGRRLAPEVGRYNLDHLAAHFGISNAARHRALGDARAAARVLIELLARRAEYGLGHLGELLDFQEKAPARIKRKR